MWDLDSLLTNINLQQGKASLHILKDASTTQDPEVAL